jgi:hypothetical protein
MLINAVCYILYKVWFCHPKHFLMLERVALSKILKNHSEVPADTHTTNQKDSSAIYILEAPHLHS